MAFDKDTPGDAWYDKAGVSRLKNDEAKLLLASIVDTMSDSLVSINLDGIITSWNKAAERIYGYTAQEAIGQPLSIVMLDKDVEPLIRKIECIRNGEHVDLYDTIRIKKGGRPMNIEVQLSPIKNEAGRVMGVSTLARDVTLLRKMEEERIESERRFHTITDVIPQIIWENDHAGKAIYFNERWYEYSGRTYEESEGVGWPVIVHPEDIYAADNWKKSLEAQEPFESEARLRRADGAYCWHLLRNVPLRSDSGKILAWFGSATNIQDQKEAERQLCETSLRLRSILEAATDFAIIMLDTDGIITEWNSGAERILGYSRTEAIGKHTDIFFTPEDQYGGISQMEMKEASRTGRSIDERWHLRKDGSRFFMSGVMTPIRDGQVAGYVKIARNITDRKLAEEALYLSEQRRNTLVQSTQMGEWDWDIINDIINQNDHAFTLLGLKPSENSHPLELFLNLVHPEDVSQVKEQLRLALDGLNVYQSEFRIVRADNKEIKWLSSYGRVVAYVDDRPARMIGVFFDITGRKLIEKQKDDFISVASHELKTPVTGIKAYSQILERIFKEQQPENTVLLTNLNRQVDRLINLIHTLLDFTTINEGKLKLKPVTFDMNELVSEEISQLQSIHPGQTLVWKPGSVALIHADKERIRQVIVNLISNAIKYSPENSEIIISSNDVFDGLMVTVCDKGVGISPEDQLHVFERYYRSGKRTDIAGLGLGLYITSQIIKQHNGTIGVDSVPGKGSTFYFKLPYS